MAYDAPLAKPAASGCCGPSAPFDGAPPEYRRALLWVIAGGVLAAIFLQSAWSITIHALDERGNAFAMAD